MRRTAPAASLLLIVWLMAGASRHAGATLESPASWRSGDAADGRTGALSSHRDHLLKDSLVLASLEALLVVFAMTTLVRQRQAGNRQRADHDRVAAIIDFFPDAVFAVDEQGMISAWNRAMERLSGAGATTMLGRDREGTAILLYGRPLPLLLDALAPGAELAPHHENVERRDGLLCAEAYLPNAHNGRGAYVCITATQLRDGTGRVVGAIETIRDVTEWVLAQRALSRSETRYRLLVETMNEGICLEDEAGRVAFVNPHFCTMLEQTPAELLGRRVTELLAPEDRLVFLQASREDASTRRAPYELTWLRRDGSFLPTLVSPARFPNDGDERGGSFAAVTDLTRLRAAEGERTRVEERYRAVFEAANDAIFLFDQHTRRLLDMNARALELTGYSVSELRVLGAIGLSAESQAVSRRAAADLVHRMDSDGPQLLEWPLRRKDGSTVWTETTVKPARVGDQDVFVGVVRDITERRLAATRVKQLNEELEERVAARTRELSDAHLTMERSLAVLQQTQAQLVESEKMAALGGLVAGIAHEINTPIGIGITAASHLTEIGRTCATTYAAGRLTRAEFERHAAAVAEHAQMILTHLGRAAELIQSFRQVAVDQSHRERRRFLVAKYLDEIMTSLSPELKRTSHQILVRCPADLEMVAPPGVLYQIVTNLVLNSLAHAYPDGRAGQMALEVSADRGRLRLVFRDEGVGMTEEVRRRAFEPFFTTRRGSGGCGLGLHIVYNLVAQTLGGTIALDSEAGCGVRFVIDVPCGGGGSDDEPG